MFCKLLFFAFGFSAFCLQIDWIGTFLDYGSLSHVNRECTAELSKYSDFELRRVQMLESPSPAPDITVRHAWPPTWTRPSTGKLVVIQPWEYGALPKEWVEWAQKVDEFWVPSHYVRNLYIASGISAKKVVVIPNGIDPEKFHSKVKPMVLPTRKKFRFLFLGGTILRKGIDVLLQAYVQEFSAKDNVCLVIKDFGGKSFYAGQTFAEQIRAVKMQPNAPEILYIDKEWPPEILPRIYTACHCLVHPYRGEGFGLPVLEAMACGLPVIVTEGGATDDFVQEEFGYRIPAKKVSLGESISGIALAGTGWELEPNSFLLGKKMKYVYEHPQEAKEKGSAAEPFVAGAYSWKKTAALIRERMQVLCK